MDLVGCKVVASVVVGFGVAGVAGVVWRMWTLLCGQVESGVRVEGASQFGL